MKPTMIASLWMAGTFAMVAGTETPVFAGATALAVPLSGRPSIPGSGFSTTSPH